jgi:hypothetical protein
MDVLAVVMSRWTALPGTAPDVPIRPAALNPRVF